jgi:hypothetical protein
MRSWRFSVAIISVHGSVVVPFRPLLRDYAPPMAP